MTTYTTVNGCGMTHYGKCDIEISTAGLSRK